MILIVYSIQMHIFNVTYINQATALYRIHGNLVLVHLFFQCSTFLYLTQHRIKTYIFYIFNRNYIEINCYYCIKSSAVGY